MSAANAQVLRKAAEVLEADGWIQGTLFRGNSSCAIGAIYKVLGSGPNSDGFIVGLTGEITGAARRLDSAVSRHLGVTGLAYWNDQRDRTEQDVVKALLETADLEEFE